MFLLNISVWIQNVTDPYGKSFETSFGIFPKMVVDIITITHDHEDHTGGIDLIGVVLKIIKMDQNKHSITAVDWSQSSIT